jgi:iron complex transport system permease protein
VKHLIHIQGRGTAYSVVLTLLIILLFAGNLLFGTVHIPAYAVWDTLFSGRAVDPSWHFILLESRLPQALTALFCGASLAACGLMLQTAFNNPLAGPSILGIDAGASLGVAVILLAGGNTAVMGFLGVTGFVAMLSGAFLGALLIMGLLLALSTVIRSNVMLLITGIMISYVTSGAISLLNFFSTQEGVHSYIIWGLGNFGGVSRAQLPWFSLLCAAGLLIAILLIKPLNALLLGNRYAENLGVNIRRTRNLLLLATGLLTAVTTAFCGPIAFIGLAVPHIARLLLGTSNHNSLMPVTLLCGSVIALLCNLICVLPGKGGILPLNAITPVLGAPVILYVIIRQRRIQYFQ